mmetsp:Transcript_12460/g.35196  ORF Transcript_12460/g.35196 Transcript_12460/m.35196 type:complete len:207 (-) Transcript_12460:1143-1763(-)
MIIILHPHLRRRVCQIFLERSITGRPGHIRDRFRPEDAIGGTQRNFRQCLLLIINAGHHHFGEKVVKLPPQPRRPHKAVLHVPQRKMHEMQAVRLGPYTTAPHLLLEKKLLYSHDLPLLNQRLAHFVLINTFPRQDKQQSRVFVRHLVGVSLFKVDSIRIVQHQRPVRRRHVERVFLRAFHSGFPATEPLGMSGRFFRHLAFPPNP